MSEPKAREEFEKWLKEWGPAFSTKPADPDCGTYDAIDTDDIWNGWQAGRRSGRVSMREQIMSDVEAIIRVATGELDRGTPEERMQYIAETARLVIMEVAAIRQLKEEE